MADKYTEKFGLMFRSCEGEDDMFSHDKGETWILLTDEQKEDLKNPSMWLMYPCSNRLNMQEWK